MDDSGFDDRTLSKLEDSREESLNAKDCKDVEDTEDCANREKLDETIAKSTSINERTKREKSIGKSEEEASSTDTGKFSRKGERSGKEQDDLSQEHSTPRISLIKPPRILAKFISPETRPSPTKHGERKSNIPIFKRSSKEFEDIRSPQESPKRSLIPQRYIIPSFCLNLSINVNPIYFDSFYTMLSLKVISLLNRFTIRIETH